MAPAITDQLTAFQHEILDAFFARERDYFLTGGAALAGFHLGHRPTDDLDLFTLQQAAFERGLAVLGDVAAALDATLEVRQDRLGFKSAILRRGDDRAVVDLVKDVTPQLHLEKLARGHIVLDAADEILANKIMTIRTVLERPRNRTTVGPPEERDLVDMMLLERLGHTIEAALPATLAKNGGCTPATLVRLLSALEVPDGIELPAGVGCAELRTYLADVIRRFQALADASAQP